MMKAAAWRPSTVKGWESLGYIQRINCWFWGSSATRKNPREEWEGGRKIRFAWPGHVLHRTCLRSQPTAWVTLCSAQRHDPDGRSPRRHDPDGCASCRRRVCLDGCRRHRDAAAPAARYGGEGCRRGLRRAHARHVLDQGSARAGRCQAPPDRSCRMHRPQRQHARREDVANEENARAARQARRAQGRRPHLARDLRQQHQARHSSHVDGRVRPQQG